MGKARVPLKAARSSPAMRPPPSTRATSPMLPPKLPARRADSTSGAQMLVVAPAPAVPKRSALSFGMNPTTEQAPPVPSSRPGAASHDAAAPIGTEAPPVPLASRPSTAQLQASEPRASGKAECLKCRDFSGPDAHAARFPRQSVPSLSVDWLAHQLTSPFPSATDKARVIFTWLHHNIEYDVVSFFNDRVRPATTQSTLASGLAVCEGYAGLFCALAARAGLQCVVIGGHGKGYGFAPLTAGSRVPPYSAGHAWNAVKIDGGAWKLVDACWGAGAVNGPSEPYVKLFSPAHFTMTNVEFGLRHFPDDRRSFFREDGRQPSWEEYMMGPGSSAGGDPVQVVTSAPAKYGLSETSFQPGARSIPVTATAMLRFQFSKTCAHWDHLRDGANPGPTYCFTLSVSGGRQIPFETTADHAVWWCDVGQRTELGGPGQTVSVNAVTQLDGRDARGLTAQAFRDAQGRKSMAWESVASWVLA